MAGCTGLDHIHSSDGLARRARPLAALVCLAAMTGVVVESRLNHRRIRAGVASRAAEQQRSP
jgi:hypothetical protein